MSHEGIDEWLERSERVLDEHAQTVRLAAAEALLDRAFGPVPMRWQRRDGRPATGSWTRWPRR